MIISHKHKFIFIKPRKVAGTSVEVNLAKFCGKKDIITSTTDATSKNDEDSYIHMSQNNAGFTEHMKPKEIKKKVGEKIWNSYTKITIVRNPWDMLVSRYYWDSSALDRITSKEPLKNIKFKAFFKLYTYKKIIRLLLLKVGINDEKKDMNRYIENYYLKYSNSEYYFNEENSLIPNFILRFETLQEDYNLLCKKLNLPSERLPRLKTKSRKTKKNYKELYTPKVRKIVEKEFQREIKEFEYTFN